MNSIAFTLSILDDPEYYHTVEHLCGWKILVNECECVMTQRFVIYRHEPQKGDEFMADELKKKTGLMTSGWDKE